MLIGYAYVVADLFHVGHLKHLCACKGLCDKLIVGVLTDAATMEKKQRPIVPYEERLVIVDTDVVLSDCSTVLYEAAIIEKPVILLDWMVKDAILFNLPNTLEAYIYRNDICYHAKSSEELPELIDRALENGVRPHTREFMERLLPTELRGFSGKRTAEILQEVANL